MTDTEREDLDAGLSSGFWKRFQAHVESEWGEVGFAKRLAAISKFDDPVALAFVRQMMVAQQEIQKLMKWPTERAQELDRQKPKEPVLLHSRRGGL